MKRKIAVIGDIHGNHTELLGVLRNLGIELTDRGWVNPENYLVIQVGDIVDYRGENAEEYSIAECVYTVRALVELGFMIAIQSNHNNKFYRWLNGNNVKINQGLDNTAREFNAIFDGIRNDISAELAAELKEELRVWFKDLPDYHILEEDGHKYIFVHAFFHPKWLNNWGKPDKELTAKQWNGIRERMLYGIRNADDERWLWWEDEEFTNQIPEDVTIIAGHYHEVNIKHPRAKVIDATPHVIAYLPLEDKIVRAW